MPADALPPRPEAAAQAPEADARPRPLEPPHIRAGLIAWIGVGAVIFVLVAIAALGGFYRLTVPGTQRLQVRAFPDPRLETTIDPRALPASLPGPVQADPPRSAQPDPALIRRAMRIVADRGAQGFEPAAPTSRGTGP